MMTLEDTPVAGTSVERAPHQGTVAYDVTTDINCNNIIDSDRSVVYDTNTILNKFIRYNTYID